MSLRAVRLPELTPDARIDAAKRDLVDALDRLVEARLAKTAALSEWVDQTNSPLGRERHLQLVRDGVLKAVKQGRLRMVKRVDINAYLETQPVKVREAADDDVEAMMRAIAGGGR